MELKHWWNIDEYFQACHYLYSTYAGQGRNVLYRLTVIASFEGVKMNFHVKDGQHCSRKGNARYRPSELAQLEIRYNGVFN